MSTPLCVLILEDQAADAELILHELRQAGFDPTWERVETRGDYLTALHAKIDVILADYAMPQFNAMEALRILQEQNLDIPFFVVTGSVSEEIAVACMKRGATDYLLKDRLARLGPAIEQALEAKQARDEHKKAEKALRESEKRYRNLFEHMPVGLYRTTSEGRILYVNHALVDMLGYPDRRSLMQVNVKDLYVDLQERKREEALLESEGVVRGFEMQLRRYDGSVIWVRDTVRTSHKVRDYVVCYEGSLEDITEQKRTEKALQESRELLQQIFDTSPNCIFVKKRDGSYLMANKTIANLYGTTPEKMVGKTDLDFAETFRLDRSEAESFMRDDREVVNTGHSKIIGEEPITLPDGTMRWFQTVKAPLSLPDVPDCILGVAVDITERKKMEERLRRQERLAAMGQLTGGLAHDFRNFLSTISLHTHIVREKADLSPEAMFSLDTVISEIRQATNLIQQILDFSRRTMINTEPVDLVTFIDEIAAILRRTLPEDVQLTLEIAPDTCMIDADPARIQQALVNLAANARDAMPEGGELRIKLSKVTEVPGQELNQDQLHHDAWGCLTMSDTGIGMTEEEQVHLFEPFFTTKEIGRGTGLGLAQVYGIVKQHQGFIDVETAEGEGTTIRIYLPVQDVEAKKANGGTGDIPPGKGETILLVEDSQRLRMAIEAVLKSLGYHVLAVTNGQEALVLYRETQDVDLIITDLMIPGMSGQELLAELKKITSVVKAIVITGDVMVTSEQELREKGFVEVVEKPFAMEYLARVVRRVLSGEGAQIQKPLASQNGNRE